MSYIIRPWARKDLKAIMGLIREAASFHKALDQVKTTPEMLRDEGFGKDATFGCLVAEVPPQQGSKEDGTIVGYQFHYLTYCTWSGHILFGEDLYVLPDFRDGAGKGLLPAPVHLRQLEPASHGFLRQTGSCERHSYRPLEPVQHRGGARSETG
ncbi:thialysine N-epsilon-acetyltransferase-like isoform X2 [Sphaerodactylus townsendi]|uniref:thialysine N-epsilon-acetyltransferase-like isoform X2 n=1 Tax=Sphaerodactylus townsendi TaxID=933632 RepID=UPI0020262B34|nr:thialysine N-epsilon-acetyltransferase-like isoform X2 [Sphaerodactylus townsendi]